MLEHAVGGGNALEYPLLMLRLPAPQGLDRVTAGGVVDQLAMRLTDPQAVGFAGAVLGLHASIEPGTAGRRGGDVGCDAHHGDATDAIVGRPHRQLPTVGLGAQVAGALS